MARRDQRKAAGLMPGSEDPKPDAPLGGMPLRPRLSKRCVDVVLIALSLPVWMPCLLLVAGIIKCVSKGPVFFLQHRIGLHGRKFLCWKFRTMHVGADTTIHESHVKELIHKKAPMTKIDEHADPRLIPFGRILRMTGLDELPQLYNVARGEMSLVGPRPCTPNEFREYLPWQMERFEVLPGVTGLWQVNGKNRTTFEEMILLDIEYAHKQSVKLDLKILARTIPLLLEETMRGLGRRRRR